MKRLFLALGLAISVAAAACTGFEHSSTTTGPSNTTGVGALMGAWASVNPIPSPSSCADFKWNVTEQTTNHAKGSFSATCAGGLKVTGTAEGTLNGSTIAWTANGNATAPGEAACAIALSGTAEIGADSIRVPYTGTTCLGPVSGVEILKRR
jgi:hypothetical protein